MADGVNDFFCEIGPNLAKNSFLQADYSVIPGLEKFDLKLASYNEVYEL